MNTDYTTKQKQVLRSQYLQIRQKLKPAEVQKKSSQLVKKLLSEIEWTGIHSLHCFLPLTDDNEPDMREFIKIAISKDITVFTNDPAKSTGRKVSYFNDDYLDSKISQYKKNAQKLDLIIVPMIAFDPSTLNRLGFGGGFYDRLIADQPQAKTIGVCFAEFATTTLPLENHDQSLQKILSV